MYTSSTLSFLSLCLSLVNAATINYKLKTEATSASISVYAGSHGIAFGCTESQDNSLITPPNLQSSNVTNCFNWPLATTNLDITWGSFNWVTIYRSRDCWSDDHVTFTKESSNITDGKSCLETEKVKGVEFVNVLSAGSILFGMGTAPMDVEFSLPVVETTAVDARRASLMRSDDL